MRYKLLMYSIVVFCTMYSVLAACNYFEPLGSCPETSFYLRGSESYNTNVSMAGGYYYFNYTSSDYNISYKQRVSEWKNGTGFQSPMGGSDGDVYIIDDYYGVQAVDDRPWLLRIQFEFTNYSLGVAEYHTIYSDDSTGLLSKNVTYYTNGTDYVVVQWNYSYLNKSAGWEPVDYELLTWNMSMKGKSLRMHVTGARSKVVSAYVNTVRNTGTNTITIIKPDNLTTETRGMNEFMLINKTAFYTVGYVLDLSNSSKYYEDETSYQGNSVQSVINKGVLYRNLTDGSRQNMDDTWYMLFSLNAMDVFIQSKNNQSTYYNTLRDKWYYETQYISSCYGPCQNNITERYYNYNFPMSKSVFFMHYIGFPFPDMSNLSFSITNAEAASISDNVTGLGGDYGMLTILQNVLNTSPWYNNTNHNGVLINATNHSALMREYDDEFYHVGDHGSNAYYASKVNRRKDILDWVWSNITNDWKNTYLYLDTEGARTLDFTDQDWNSSAKGMLKQQLVDQQVYLDYIHTQGYPIEAENWAAIWTAGLIDSGEGNKVWRYDEGLNGTIPSYILSQIASKMVISQGHLKVFMPGWNTSTTWKYGTNLSDRVYFDRFVVMSIVQAQRPRLDGFNGDYHNISDNLTILNLYSLDYVTQLMYNGTVSDVQYVNQSNGVYMTLSDSYRSGYDFNNPVVYETFSNGLTILANLNMTGWWNTTIYGKTVNMPPNSLYAKHNNSVFEMFYNDANLSTWVITPNYVYAYPKSGSVSFSFPYDYYYVYEYRGDDSTNGLLYSRILPGVNTSSFVNPCMLISSGLTSATYTASVSTDESCNTAMQSYQLILLALGAVAILFLVGLFMKSDSANPVLIGILLIVVPMLVYLGIKILSTSTSLC